MINQLEYKYYVVLFKYKIESGWEHSDEANDHLENNLLEPFQQYAKVLQFRGLLRIGLNPRNDADWAQWLPKQEAEKAKKVEEAREYYAKVLTEFSKYDLIEMLLEELSDDEVVKLAQQAKEET